MAFGKHTLPACGSMILLSAEFGTSVLSLPVHLPFFQNSRTVGPALSYDGIHHKPRVILSPPPALLCTKIWEATIMHQQASVQVQYLFFVLTVQNRRMR